MSWALVEMTYIYAIWYYETKGNDGLQFLLCTNLGKFVELDDLLIS